MGRFTEEMRRLRAATHQAQQARNQLKIELNRFKSELNYTVEYFLNECQTLRLVQAAADHTQRQEYVNHLATEVRQHCESFRQNLTEQVIQLRQRLHTEHAERTERLRVQQQAFRTDLTETVQTLRTHCVHEQQQRQQEFVAMTQYERAQRYEFVHHLTDTVAEMRTELTADRAEANRIWFGMRTPSSPQTTQKPNNLKNVKLKEAISELTPKQSNTHTLASFFNFDTPEER